MKNPLLIPFLAILLTVFVVSFISKQEQNTDEKLFREYLKGFPQAKLPLEVTAKLSTFNPQKTIPKKFDKFLLESMKPHFMSRIPSSFQNEYAYKITENDSIIVVLCGSISTPTDIEHQKKYLRHTKNIIIYDKKGNIIDEETISSNDRKYYRIAIFNADLVCETQYYKKNKKNHGSELAQIQNFSINSSGKILTIKEEVYIPSALMKDID